MKHSKKHKPLIKKSSLAHPDFRVPHPCDVSLFEYKLHCALKKHSCKWYAKHRLATERKVIYFLVQSRITPTVNFRFYYLIGMNVLNGKDFLYYTPSKAKMKRQRIVSNRIRSVK